MKQFIKQTCRVACLMTGLLLFAQCQDEQNEYNNEYACTPLSTSRQEATLRVGKTDTLLITAGTGEYKVLSMNTNIVNATLKKNQIEMTGLREGRTELTLFDIKSEQTHKVKINVLNRIPDLTVSSHNVRVVEGDTYIVKIVQGSEDYEISMEKSTDGEPVVKSEMVKNKELHITGLKVGDTSLIIRDKQTNQTEEVRIRVERKVPDIKTEVESLDLYEQERRTVKIIQGSGEYSANPDNPGILKVRIIKGNILDIVATNVGQTKIFVADNVTKKHVEINVRITPFKGINPFIIDGVRYSYLDPNNVEVMSMPQGQYYQGIVNVPATVINAERANTPLNVIAVGTRAFLNNDKITEVILPASIQEIKAEAFYHCTRLERINLPEGLRQIEKNAFSDTKIRQINIPASVDNIELPFCLNAWTEAINVASGNQVYSSEDGILYGKEVDEYADEPNTMVKVLIAIPTLKEIKEYNVPDDVKYIKENACYGQKNLETIQTNGCIEIGKHAFENCNKLNTIIFGEIINDIMDYAFYGDDNILTIANLGSPANLYDNPFTQKVYEHATVYIYPKYNRDYIYAPIWSDFKHYDDIHKLMK